ncbi:MAG: carboxymuconolactone decarboxylase family protein [Azoarcus sp.]|jgi:AhpD family alkylhydroperoxidase|nr:carboxymuconolactone decarboxylase family protein [Azoarcus sp.]
MSAPTSHYPDALRKIMGQMKALGVAAPAVMQSFGNLGKAAIAEGALDGKTKELIALALGVASRCEGCVAFHANMLVNMGATRAEVAETLGVAIQMGGGPSMMWATEALTAFDEFAAQKKA